MFLRDYDDGTDGAFANNSFPATVSTFRLDQYVVTVGRFRQFVGAGMGTQQQPPSAGAGARTLNGAANQGGWDPAWNGSLAADKATLVAGVKCDATYAPWTDTAGANESLPMTCITWYEAMAFCVWDGGFLPTNAELDYAAQGGNEQRAYPWSFPPSSLAIDCAHASYGGCPPPQRLTPVGADSPAGDGRWGHADLAGNAFQFPLDAFGSYATSCDDCADLTSPLQPGANRVIRGGAFFSIARVVRGAARNTAAPGARAYYIGVRCARP